MTLLALAGSALLSVACPHKPDAHHAGYVKPGAAVMLSHDYDGQTAVGEFETVTAHLDHIYDDGLLSVELLEAPGLQLLSTRALKEHPISSGSTLAFPIQFSSTVAGHYTLSLQTIYESPLDHESRRVVSIPIVIGKTSMGKVQPERMKTTKSNRLGVVRLPAMETIE